MATDYLVDRNIRQKFLPFVLNPDGYNNVQEKNVDIQHWSFRNKDNPNAKFGIMPCHNNRIYSDISFRQLFQYQDKNLDLTINDLLNQIPAIQIREYTQDTRLDAVVSLVDFFKQGVEDGAEISKELNTSDKRSAFAAILTDDLQKMTHSDLWKKIVESATNLIGESGTSEDDSFYKSSNQNEDKKWIIDFIYMMYYRLLTTTTSNIYTIPNSSEQLLVGNGEVGFETASGFSFGGGNGLIGSALKFIAPSINLTLTPIWRGISGGEGVNIDITFNLFNDDLKKAVTNFIFVNTLLPQNLPTQYGILAQPPSLYDIRIEGGNRLFMCSGKFECKSKGVLRKPNKFLGTELGKHLNPYVIKDTNESTIENMINKGIIRIPDIYEVTMHFKSLLPNTFNNLLFQFALNSRIEIGSKEGTKTVDQMGFAEDTNITASIREWLKDASKASNQYADDILNAKKIMDQKIKAAKMDNTDLKNLNIENAKKQFSATIQEKINMARNNTKS